MTCTATVVDGRQARAAFNAVPWRVYTRDPNWVPPLPGEESQTFDPRRNPTLMGIDAQRWVVRRDGAPVARIAAFSSSRWPAAGYFGYLESHDDPDAARTALRAAEAWLASRGCQEVHGPIDIIPRDRIGLLVEGFDRAPVLFTPYNPPYYARLLEAAGYAAAIHLRAYAWVAGYQDPRHLLDLSERLGAHARIRIRKIDPRRLRDETRIMAQLINTTLAHAWRWEPISETEADQLAELLRPIMAPDLALIAEDDDGPCGVALGVPDANWWWQNAGGRLLPFGWARLLATRRRIPRARVMVLGVLPGRLQSGLAVRLIAELIRGGERIGLEYVELSQIFADNAAMDRVLDRLGFPVVRRYAVYSRTLAHEGAG